MTYENDIIEYRLIELIKRSKLDADTVAAALVPFFPCSECPMVTKCKYIDECQEYLAQYLKGD